MIPPIMSLMKAVIYAVLNTQQAVIFFLKKILRLKRGDALYSSSPHLANLFFSRYILLLMDYGHLVLWVDKQLLYAPCRARKTQRK